MDFRRVRLPELLALLSGVGLLVAMFQPWYEFRGGRLDAWDSLTVTLVPLTLAALAAIWLFAVTLTQAAPALPVAAAVWTTLLGLIATPFALVRALSLPGSAIHRCYGVWLGLGFTIAVLVAAWLAMRDERPLRGVQATQPRAAA